MKRKISDAINVFYQLTKRHFLVFFKNKIRVFYTMMVPLIIIAVYIVFLRQLELNTVKNILLEENVLISEGSSEMKMIESVVDSWMLSGILTLSTITISIQTNNIIINDKENGVNRDFASSPISRNFLIGSYFVFNFIVTLLICLIVLVVCLLYLAFMGEFHLNFVDILEILGVLILSTITSTLMTIFICSFIKKESTLASLIAIFSAVAGFLIGAYMPLNMFHPILRNVCCFVPGTYSCGMMRFAFMDTGLNELTNMLQNIENGPALLEALTENFGFSLEVFGYDLEVGYQAIVNIVCVVILAVMNIFSAKYLAKVTSNS